MSTARPQPVKRRGVGRLPAKGPALNTTAVIGRSSSASTGQDGAMGSITVVLRAWVRLHDIVDPMPVLPGYLECKGLIGDHSPPTPAHECEAGGPVHAWGPPAFSVKRERMVFSCALIPSVGVKPLPSLPGGLSLPGLRSWAWSWPWTRSPGSRPCSRSWPFWPALLRLPRLRGRCAR